MTDETEKPLKLIVETLEEGELINEAERLRLVVEGEKETVLLLSEAIYEVIGDGVVAATVYRPNGEQEDITEEFQSGPSRLDLLSAGDTPEA